MINVIWYDGMRGSWDHGLLQSIFDKHPDKFIQHNVKSEPYTGEKAIVIVVGNPDPIPLRAYLQRIWSGVVIFVSDEDSRFVWKYAMPPHLEAWTQYYSPNKSEIKERILLGAPNRIKDYKINSHPKKYVWSFVGQVQNPSRQRCVEVLKTMPDGFLHIAGAFGGQENGIEYQEYLDIMCQSMFVICPGGSMSVDSFRVYEAMECNAIPITEKRAPRDANDFDYWDSVHSSNDMIILDSWNELPGIVEMYDGNNEQIRNLWWTYYKTNLENKLLALC